MAENFQDNEDRQRFELEVEGHVAFVTWRKSPGAITLVHTEVPPELKSGSGTPTTTSQRSAPPTV